MRVSRIVLCYACYLVLTLSVDVMSSELKEYSPEFLEKCSEDHLLPACKFLADNQLEPLTVVQYIQDLPEGDDHIFFNSLLIMLNKLNTSIADIKNKEGNTILHVAAMKGYYGIIQSIILKYSAELLYTLNQHQETALMFACIFNKLETASALIEFSGDDAKEFVAIKNQKGAMAIDSAAEHGYTIIIQKILEIADDDAVAWVTTARYADRTPLHWVAKSGSIDALKSLIEKIPNEELVGLLRSKDNKGYNVAAIAQHECQSEKRRKEFIEFVEKKLKELDPTAEIAQHECNNKESCEKFVETKEEEIEQSGKLATFGWRRFWSYFCCLSSGYEKI